MLFDVQAALAEILATPVATVATLATNGPSVADVAASQRQISERPKVLPFVPAAKAPPPSQDKRDDFRRSGSTGDRPTTWTGRVVSLDEWRRLTEWDKAGPNGRLFCGICRAWVHGFPDCHGGAA